LFAFSDPRTMETIIQLPSLPPRPAESNKGMFGKVLIVAGSRGMSGAAVLCASGALRGGAGLVRLAVPESLLSIVAGANPCYLTAPLDEDSGGRIADRALGSILDWAEANDVMALGPGLGRSESLTELVIKLLAQVYKPLVLDADGLNALEGRIDSLKDRGVPTILTPHPGELGRLLGTSAKAVQDQRLEHAVPFAAAHRVILVLKGHGSIVTDGRKVYINSTGNSGMATGGTGDVLTGLIAAFLGQGLDPFAAAQLGVHVHGLAGDLARDKLGEVGLIASDLLDHLPRAIQNF
jgi:ADP-dependent NAD(P)H-hydrate dehydratase